MVYKIIEKTNGFNIWDTGDNYTITNKKILIKKNDL